MVGADAAALKRAVSQSVEKIARLRDGEGSGEVFTELKQGVYRASKSKDAGLDELLADIEPKVAVLKFLLELYGKKRMYQKQIEEVVKTLLQVDPWLRAWREDADLQAGLPESLQEVVQEVEAAAAQKAAEAAAAPKAAPAAAAPKTAPSSAAVTSLAPTTAAAPKAAPSSAAVAKPDVAAESSPPTRDEMQKAIDEGMRRVEAAKGPVAFGAGGMPTQDAPAVGAKFDGVAVAVEQLNSGRDKIVAMHGNVGTDTAVEAFCTFEQAVNKISQSSTKEDDALLERLEPKAEILTFLLRFYEKHRLHKRKVYAMLQKLSSFDSWRVVAETIPLVASILENPPRHGSLEFSCPVLENPPAGAEGKAVPLPPPHSAPSSAEAAAPARAARKSSSSKWVAWVSVEPKTGRIQLYPSKIMHHLEIAQEAGMVDVDLGNDFFGATVILGSSMKQRTKTGSRDIRRVEFDEPNGPVSLFVVKVSDWRVAADRSTKAAEERKMDVPIGAAIEIRDGVRVHPD